MAKLLRLLTSKEAAKLLGISVGYLRTICREDSGPQRIRGSKRFYFTRDALEQWLSVRAPERVEQPRLGPFSRDTSMKGSGRAQNNYQR
jgi:hypothetical protein